MSEDVIQGLSQVPVAIREISRATDVADLLTFLPSEQAARIEIVHNDKEASIALVALD